MLINLITTHRLKKAVTNEEMEKVKKIISKRGIPDRFFKRSHRDDMHQLLCFVASENLYEIVKLIITNKKFTENKVKHDFSKVLRITIKNENLEIMEMLLNKVITGNFEVPEYSMLLVIAIKKNNLPIARLLIKSGTVINPAGMEDEFLLTYAVENHQLGMIRLLLDNGAAMKNNESQMICNLLHLALCYNCNSDVIEMLLTYRNDQINVRNKNGDNALLRAVVLNKNTRTINILLDNNADINATNNNGQTSLDFIVKRLSVSSYSSYKTILKTAKGIIEHIAKLKCFDSHVSEHNLSLISSRDDLRTYLKECEKEIFLMIASKVHQTNISFFDILVGNIVTLAKYTDNRRVIRYFNGNDLVIHFPIYAMTMKRRLREALELKSDIEKCVDIFEARLELPYYCIDNILRYCTKYDVRNIAKIYDLND